MMTLIELDANLRSLIDYIEMAEIADDQPALEQLLADYIATSQSIDKKIDAIAAVIKECEYYAQVRRSEMVRYQKLTKRDEETVSFLKTYLKQYMDRNGIPQIKTKRFNLRICKNGGKTPIILDGTVAPQDYPSDCREVEYRPDMDTIRDKLEAGEDLPFATWGERGTHLRIS